ncbi:MAG: hypothetical protein ABIJ85_03440 [bacterium]
MLKKVLLVTPGSYGENDLTPRGIDNVRWLGRQTTTRELRPKIVFFTNEKECMHSALIFAGVVKSVDYVASLGSSFDIPSHELLSDIDLESSRGKRIWTRKKINLQNEKRKKFWRQFRDALRTEETARAYLEKACPIPDDVEEVAIVSVPGFGGVFPKWCNKPLAYTLWICPIIWTLDVQTQTLSPSAEIRERFNIG